MGNGPSREPVAWSFVPAAELTGGDTDDPMHPLARLILTTSLGHRILCDLAPPRCCPPSRCGCTAGEIECKCDSGETLGGSMRAAAWKEALRTLARMARTSRRWRQLAYSDEVWSQLLDRMGAMPHPNGRCRSQFAIVHFLCFVLGPELLRMNAEVNNFVQSEAVDTHKRCRTHHAIESGLPAISPLQGQGSAGGSDHSCYRMCGSTRRSL